jgi:hypothetical protein
MVIPSFEPADFIPFLIFSIPIVAIAGGITAGIVKSIGQQRLAELSQRERIAAIERGVDPAKLPAPVMYHGDEMALSPYEHARRRSQGLIIGGLIVLAVGVSLGIFLQLVSGEENLWAVGLIPGSVGVALLLSAWIVRPTHEDRRTSAPVRHE